MAGRGPGSTTPATPDAEPAASAPARSDAGRRTSLLTLALVLASTLLLWRFWPDGPVGDSVPLRWWSIAVIAAVTDMLVFRVEFRRETYTFTFAEVVLVLGLFLAPPGHLIVGRLLGELGVLALKERQSPRKIALNLASFYAECAVMLVGFGALAGGRSIEQPVAWLLALGAVIVAELVGFLTVGTVIRWHGGSVDLRRVVVAGLLTAPVNTSLGLTAGILLVVRPWATLLLTGVAVFLVVTYRSYAALSTRHQSLTLLYDVTRLMSGSKRPDAVLEAMSGQARELLRAERAQIWVAEEGGGFLAVQVDAGGLVAPAAGTSAARALLAHFAEHRGVVMVTKASAVGPTSEFAALLGSTDCMVAPITDGDAVVGAIAVIDRIGELSTFEPSDARIFGTLAGHASEALGNSRLIDRLHDEARRREHDAHHDALTGLPNRVLFRHRLLDRLEAARADGSWVTVAVMDLDGFKDINDTLGHQAGDLVLGEIARRLDRTVDDSVTVARLGGDEFALVFGNGTSRDDAQQFAALVGEVVAAPIPIGGLMLEVGVSIGLASSTTDGTEPDLLVQRADVAMYVAKAGGGGFQFYRADTDENTPRRSAMTNEIRTAVDAGQIACVYQPEVRLADGVIVGVEALVRWEHPVFGTVLPEEFLPLAERTGVVPALTSFVLATAIEQAGRWAAAGHRLGVSVNLGTRNLLDAELTSTVARLVATHDLDPCLLTLELSEVDVMADPSRSIKVLGELAAIGVRVAIDGFGIGASSLPVLQRLPVSELKIDRSLVVPVGRDVDAARLVAAVVGLARSFGIAAVAVGIEDEATERELRTMGVAVGQGLHLYAPCRASELAAVLTAAAQPPSARTTQSATNVARSSTGISS